MARTEIGSQNGIKATQVRLENLDPAVGEVAYANQATTLTALVGNDKDHETRLKALEDALASRPF